MKINIINIIILSLLIFTACNDFLAVDPTEYIGEGSFYKNTEDINQAVLACYGGLQKCTNDEWFLTELRSDNSRHYVGNSTNQISKNIYDLDKNRIATTHTENEAYWESVYHNIANCNIALKHLDVVTEENLKKQFEGEVLFIRSLHYFNLVRLYGPIFLLTKSPDIEEIKTMERSSVNLVYAQIEEDLKAAIDNRLPVEHSADNKGRADIWAAKSLLAKVYITLERWSEAKPLLEDIKDNSGYKLLKTSYSDVFSTSNEMNSEIIFAVRYKAGGYGLGSPFANNFAPANSFAFVINSSGDGYNCPSYDLIQSYDPADKRKNVSLSETWENLDKPEGERTIFTAYVKKYLSPVSAKYDAENDWPILRFADILLLLAETENELSGPTTTAIDLLNETRQRAGLSKLTEDDVKDKNQFRKEIEKERRFEFAFENQRFFDLIRTNRFISVMEAHYETEQTPNSSSGNLTGCYTDPGNAGSYMTNRKLENWQLLLPIPLSVISGNELITQNPGY